MDTPSSAPVDEFKTLPTTERAALYLRFERGSDLFSWLVSLSTGSYHTHVDLVLSLEKPEYLGAFPFQGVVLHKGGRSQAELFVKLPKPVPFTVWAKELGKPYDWLALLRALIVPYPNEPALDPRRWYCTELAAYLAEATGVKSFRGIITPDNLLDWILKHTTRNGVDHV